MWPRPDPLDGHGTKSETPSASHGSQSTRSTENEEKIFEKFAETAGVVVEDAQYEAARRGDQGIGTEHLLIALLHDDGLAQAVGVDAASTRKAENRLDGAALAAIGLEFSELPSATSITPGKRGLRMTPGAKAVIQRALARAATENARAITPRQLLLAIVDRNAPDPAASLLSALNVDRSALREQLDSAA